MQSAIRQNNSRKPLFDCADHFSVDFTGEAAFKAPTVHHDGGDGQITDSFDEVKSGIAVRAGLHLFSFTSDAGSDFN